MDILTVIRARNDVMQTDTSGDMQTQIEKAARILLQVSAHSIPKKRPVWAERNGLWSPSSAIRAISVQRQALDERWGPRRRCPTEQPVWIVVIRLESRKMGVSMLSDGMIWERRTLNDPIGHDCRER
jgi:hypothetical protein